MKTQLLLVAGLTGIVTAAYGQSFNVNFITGPSPLSTPLKQGVSGSLLAPSGSTIWFVQDTAKNGFFASSLTTLSVAQANSMLNGGADDAVMLTSSIGGATPDGQTTGLTGGLGGQAGKTDNLYTTTSGGLDKAANIYAVLWTGASGNVVSMGDTFGILNLGTLNAASYDLGLNTYTMGINADIFSGTITVVPEPSAYAAIFGLSSLAGVITYRRFKK
jgi:hypothetical protein